MATMANQTTVAPLQVCISMADDLHYKGTILSKNPLDCIVPLFMFQIIFFVVISRLLYVILRPLKQPKFVCNILGGIIIGPSVLGRNKSYMDIMFPEKEMLVLASMSSMASTLFVFLVCIKTDVAMLCRTAKKTWRIGVSSMAVPFLFTISFLALLRHCLPGLTGGSFYLQFSVVSSLSFFIVIVNALDELNLLSSELGQLSTCIALLNEIVEFVIIVFGIASEQKDKLHMLYSVLALAALIAFAVFVIRPILLWMINTTPKGQPVKEGYVIAVILGTLLMSLASDALGATLTFSAMIMGFIIPDGPPLGATIIQKSELLIYEFFLPAFYLRIGYYTNLSTIQDWSEFVVFGVVILAGYLGRILGSCMVSSSLNLKTRSAILLSLILSLQGIIELLHGIHWLHQKSLSDQNFATLVLTMVVLNAIITPIVEILHKAELKSKMSSTSKPRSRSLGRTSQIGELRIISCIQNEDNVPSIISIHEALNPRDVSPICAYVIHLIPLATQTVPLLVPYKNHGKMLSNHDDSDNIMRAFLNYSNYSQGHVQIQPFRMISPFKYMHEPICRLAEEVHSPLIIVPFFKSLDAHSSTEGTLRIFNANIQASSRCTVGILVDRGLRAEINSTTIFSYNVAVIFLGGSDDREALAFAARMSNHPNVSITVLRISMIGESGMGFDNERELDDWFFKDFKNMTVANACVVCHEMVAENYEEVIQTLRSLGNSYDIVFVGKRQGCNSQFEQELINWTEYPELGVIGDVIAAPDFCGGMMSVLVFRRHGQQHLSSSGHRYLGSQCL